VKERDNPVRLVRWLSTVAALIAGLAFGIPSASASAPHHHATASSSATGDSTTSGSSVAEGPLDWWW
jgi:hypothetical protein